MPIGDERKNKRNITNIALKYGKIKSIILTGANRNNYSKRWII